jgi:hypothetical protein
MFFYLFNPTPFPSHIQAVKDIPKTQEENGFEHLYIA